MNRMPRTFLLLSALASVVALEACGSRTTSNMVTETGNPPFIDRDRIAVDLSGDVATVSGKPGAVPGGALVRVENSRTGADESATADDDGSFEVEIAAEPGDDLQIEVEGEDGSRSFDLAVSAAGDDEETTGDETDSSDEPSTDPGASTDSEGEPNSCEDLTAALQASHFGLLDGVDSACTEDADCVQLDTPFTCYTWACPSGAAISLSGQAEVNAGLSSVDEACEALLDADCPKSITPCPSRLPETPVCAEGQCTYPSQLELLTCEAATAVLTQVQDSFRDDIDTSCEQDTDCALSDVDLNCGNVAEAVASSALTDANARLDEVTQACSVSSNACGGATSLLPLPPPPSGAFCSAQVCRAAGGGCEAQAEQVDSALADVVLEAQGACATDADCVAVPAPDLSCSASCVPLVGISATNQASFDARVAELEPVLCGPFETESCNVPNLTCAMPPPSVAACVQSKCGLRELTFSAEECNTIATAAEAELRAFIDASDKSCSVDADCKITDPSTACRPSCTELVIANASAEAIESKRDEIGAGACDELVTDSCAFEDGSCTLLETFPNGIGCVEGQCGAKPNE